MAQDVIFDFGFSAVDETELESLQKATADAEKASASASNYEEKLNTLYNSIQPLLSNLKKNPEKDYIYWPNRLEKVEKFEDLISSIINQ